MATSTHDANIDERNQSIKIYLNGNVVPRAEATVSVYDSGFMLGDGVWEGLRLHNGVVCFLEEHLERLYAGALMLNLDIGMPAEALARDVYRTLEANDMHDDVHLRLMVTRGLKRRPFQHPGLSDSGPTIVIIAEHSRVDETIYQQGITLHTVPNHRGAPLTQDPKLNSHSKLNCILALNQAIQAGADEALMLDPLGFVNTTNSTNFFIVRHGEVWTSTGDYCMNGVTRQQVIDLCRENDIPVQERNYSLVDAYSADEAFVTGTFGAQTPVSEIDGRALKQVAGPMFMKIRALYSVLIKQHCDEVIAVR